MEIVEKQEHILKLKYRHCWTTYSAEDVDSSLITLMQGINQGRIFNYYRHKLLCFSSFGIITFFQARIILENWFSSQLFFFQLILIELRKRIFFGRIKKN